MKIGKRHIPSAIKFPYQSNVRDCEALSYANVSKNSNKHTSSYLFYKFPYQ